ncbi:MAG: PTS sugar transporter subunit IIA [Erysipelotrichaceae bacterium]|nr:PTS sugar transporter subunit IIA [Erysipelotrichaceae bacterium]
MLKIFLSSHGHLASGLKSSLDVLLGNSDQVTVFDAYVDDRLVSDELDKFYETVTEEDEVLLLSDLYGGSVNSKMVEYLVKPNTRLVAGVNLALVLELAMKPSISDDELQQVIDGSRSMMRQVILDTTPVEESEEEFF